MKKFKLNKSKKDNYADDLVEDLTKDDEEHKIEEQPDRMDDGGKAKVLDKPKLNVGKTIPAAQIEEIIKTTDSMQIVAKSFKNTEETDSKRLQEASRAILKSYDLAIRKIKATYEDIIDTKKSISNEFLTVQILIKKYEQFPDIKQIANVINIFSEEVETLLSYGKGVWFSNDLVLEAADYINKMIPIARIITPDTIIVNMLKWEEVADNLVRQNKITVSEKGIISSLAKAINQNLKNGYYVKFGNLIIARINPNDAECMILFSGETILRMNKIYSGERATRNKRATNKLNYLNKFMSSVAQQKEKEEQEMKKIDLSIRENKINNEKRNDEIIDREENDAEGRGDLADKFEEREFTESFEEDLSNTTITETGVKIINQTSEINLKDDSEDDEDEITNEPQISESEIENVDHVEDYVDPKDKKAVKAAKKLAKQKAKEEKRLAKTSVKKGETSEEQGSEEQGPEEQPEVEVTETDATKEEPVEEINIEETPSEEIQEEEVKAAPKKKPAAKKKPVTKKKPTTKKKTTAKKSNKEEIK